MPITRLKKILLLGCCCFLPGLGLRAQSPSDNPKVISLLARCDTVKNDMALMASDEGATIRKLANEGLGIVPADDAADRSQFYYYLAQGYLFVQSISPDTVSNYFLLSLEEAKKARSARLIANAAISMLHIGFEMQNPNQVETYKALLQSVMDTTRDQRVLPDGYAALGTYYQQKAYYSTAQDLFLKSIELERRQPVQAWTLKMKTDFASRCYTLARLYMKTETLDKALNTLRTGLPFAKASYLIDIRYKASFIDVFSKTGNIDSALYYLHQYIDPMEEHFKDRKTLPDVIVLGNLSVAQYYIDQQAYDKAKPYLDKLVAYPVSKIEDFEAYQIAQTNGRYYEQTGNFSKAIALFTQALPIAKQLSKDDYTDLLKLMAVAQQGNNNLNSALQYYREYNESLDTITREKISRNFADQQTRYETNQKEQQIVTLDKVNKLNNLELQTASRTRMFLVLGLIGLSIIALLFYFIYRNREKLNKALHQQKQELEKLNRDLSTANDTKAKLFGIISHDLRSPVSQIAQLLQLQKEDPQLLDQESSRQHEETLKRATENVLETMEDLLLWSKSQMQFFKPELKNTDIAAILARETRLLQDSLQTKQLSIRQDLPQPFLQLTDENFITVILRNLLHNAVKFSNPASHIIVLAADKKLSIYNTSTTADVAVLNSQLLNKDVDSKASGLGLQIVSDLAAAIHVQLSFEKQGTDQLVAVLRWSS